MSAKCCCHWALTSISGQRWSMASSYRRQHWTSPHRLGQLLWNKVIEWSHWILIVSPFTSPLAVFMGYNWISKGFAQVVKAIFYKLTCGIDYQWKEELYYWPTSSVCVDIVGWLNCVFGMRIHLRFFQNVTSSKNVNNNSISISSERP